MLPIYSYVNDQLGPLSGFVSFQPLMSIPGHYHRVQPDKSSFEEACQTHPVPSVIVSISDDESREHEEKINRKIAVVDDLICGAA